MIKLKKMNGKWYFTRDGFAISSEIDDYFHAISVAKSVSEIYDIEMRDLLDTITKSGIYNADQDTRVMKRPGKVRIAVIKSSSLSV